MKKLILAGIVACLFVAAPVRAEILDVFAGDHLIYAGLPDQHFQVTVQGDGHVQGMTLRIQIGVGTTGDVPAITDADLTQAGFLFGGNNNGNQGDGSGAPFGYAGYWEIGTTTVSDFVSPDGQEVGLVDFTIDTTGFQPGQRFALYIDKPDEEIFVSFAGWENGEDQSGNPNQLFLHNGTITIIPEPGSLALWAGCLVIGAVFYSRRRKK